MLTAGGAIATAGAEEEGAEAGRLFALTGLSVSLADSGINEVLARRKAIKTSFILETVSTLHGQFNLMPDRFHLVPWTYVYVLLDDSYMSNKATETNGVKSTHTAHLNIHRQM